MTPTPLFVFELLASLGLEGKIFLALLLLFVAFEALRIRKFGTRVGGFLTSALFYVVVLSVVFAVAISAGWFDPALDKIAADISTGIDVAGQLVADVARRVREFAT